MATTVSLCNYKSRLRVLQRTVTLVSHFSIQKGKSMVCTSVWPTSSYAIFHDSDNSLTFPQHFVDFPRSFF